MRLSLGGQVTHLYQLGRPLRRLPQGPGLWGWVGPGLCA